MKKLWVDGRASEDREESMEVMRAHCARCYDYKDKTSQVQTGRIREQRCRGDTGLLGKDEKKQIEEQGERSEQLLGD